MDSSQGNATVARLKGEAIRFRPVLLPWAVVAGWALLGGMALLFGWRRGAGYLQTPLSAILLILVAGGLAGLATAIRLTWQPNLWPPFRNGIVTASVLIVALAISLPGTSWAGLMGLWGLVIAGECWGWRAAMRWGGPRGNGPEEADVRAAVASKARSGCDDVGGSADPTTDPHEGDVVQQFVRRVSPGSESFSGWLRVPLAAGQRTASVHLAFCPAFAHTPQVTVEQQEGPTARIKEVQVLPYGARFDLKLAQPSGQPESVVLEVFAEAAPVAIAIAVVQQAGRVLIGKRPPGVALAGLWEFPGGKIRPGETAAQAAARECREETGLDVSIGESWAEIFHDYDHGSVRLHFFAAEPRDAALPPREPFHWVDVQQLAAYPFPPANRPILERLAQAPRS